jgi:hypothetical protein
LGRDSGSEKEEGAVTMARAVIRLVLSAAALAAIALACVTVLSLVPGV